MEGFEARSTLGSIRDAINVLMPAPHGLTERDEAIAAVRDALSSRTRELVQGELSRERALLSSLLERRNIPGNEWMDELLTCKSHLSYIEGNIKSLLMELDKHV